MATEESSSHTETPNEVVEHHQSTTAPGAPDAATPVVRSDETVVRGASPMAMWSNVIYLVFAIICGLIAIRFVLKLLGANPSAGFANLIYGVTAPFMGPFNGLLGTPQVNGSQFEISSLVAIAIYALLGWVLIKLVGIGLNRSVSVSHREVH